MVIHDCVLALGGPAVRARGYQPLGRLNIVEPGLLPLGMVSIFRDKRAKWQG